MSEAVETIEIVNPKKAGEKWIMNKADFDPKQHKLWEEPAESLPPSSGGPPEKEPPKDAPRLGASPRERK